MILILNVCEQHAEEVNAFEWEPFLNNHKTTYQQCFQGDIRIEKKSIDPFEGDFKEVKKCSKWIPFHCIVSSENMFMLSLSISVYIRISND